MKTRRDTINLFPEAVKSGTGSCLTGSNGSSGGPRWGRVGDEGAGTEGADEEGGAGISIVSSWPPKVILTQAQSGKSLSGPQTADTVASSVQETGEGGGHRLGEWMLLETSVVYPSTIPPQECYWLVRVPQHTCGVAAWVSFCFCLSYMREPPVTYRDTLCLGEWGTSTGEWHWTKYSTGLQSYTVLSYTVYTVLRYTVNTVIW